MAYGIGKKGVDWLRRERPLLFQRPVKKQSVIGRLFLEHALLVSEILVTVELACRQRQDVCFLSGTDPEHSPPSHWGVTIGHNLKYQVAPDAVFGIERAGQTQWFFLEADRGTMPVTRRSLQSSSLRRKFECYAATWKQKVHERHGIRRFRVLTVTSKSERCENMVEVCRGSVKAGAGLFLFTTLSALRNESDFWDLPWQTVYSDTPVSLLH